MWKRERSGKDSKGIPLKKSDIYSLHLFKTLLLTVIGNRVPEGVSQSHSNPLSLIVP